MSYSNFKENRLNKVQDDYVLFSCQQVQNQRSKCVYFEQNEDNNKSYFPSHWKSPNTQQINLLIDQLYYQGYFILKVLSCSFTEFELAIKESKGAHPYNAYRNFLYQKRNQKFFHYHPVEFREKMSFRQHGVSPKEEIHVKNDWREKKGFTRDYRKNQRGLNKNFPKKCSNRSFRAMERKLLSSGQYEKLHNKTRKDFFDPWDWD